MQADIGKLINVKLVGQLDELLLRVDPSYKRFLVYKNNAKVNYTELNKALYGTLQGALLFEKKLSSYLLDNLGFIANPYDSSVMNKDINDKEFIIVWHVDDLKLSHIDETVIEDIIAQISSNFGKEAPLTVTGENIHDHLGIRIDFTKAGQVQFAMFEYIDQIVSETPDKLHKDRSVTPTTKHLFNVNQNSTKLNTATFILYHHLVTQLLYLGKRTRPDILPTV